MAKEVLFCNGSQEKVAFNEILCSLMEKAAMEAAIVVGKLAVYLLLAMGSASNGFIILGDEAGINQGTEDLFADQVVHKGRRGETQVKDDGETDDDDDDDDEDADEQDDDVGEEPSDEEGNPNEEDEVPEELEANGEEESDDGEDDDDEDDEDDDDEDDDDDDDDEDEDEEEEEDEEEIPEPPSKKRK